MKRHLPLFLLLFSCTADKAQVSVDLSSVYKKDGLSVVSNTKLEITRLRYFLVAPSALATMDTSGPARGIIGSSGGVAAGTGAIAFEIDTTVSGARTRVVKSEEVTPDPATLSFTIDAPAGINRGLGLVGTTTRDGAEHLAYLGVATGITLKPLVDNEVRVAVYPAGLVIANLSLKPDDQERIKSTGYAGPLGCELTVKRVTPLDGATIEQQTFAPFGGFPLPELAADDAQSIFGVGTMALPVGDYLASCKIHTTIGEIVLADNYAFSITHAGETKIAGELDLPDGPTNNVPSPNGRPSVFFGIATSDSALGFLRQANILSNGNSQVAIKAKQLSGSPALDFSSDLLLRFHRVDVQPNASSQPEVSVNRQKGVQWPVKVTGQPATTNNEYKVSMTAGAASVNIDATEDFLGIIEVVSINPTTGMSEEHNSGMALFHISAASRCVPRPLLVGTIVDNVSEYLPVVQTERAALDLNAAGNAGVDMHALFAFTAPENQAGARRCVLESFLGTFSSDFPALKISAPFIGGVRSFEAINQVGINYSSLTEAAGFAAATIPLRLFTDGQMMVPNTLRLSPTAAAAAAAAGQLNLTLSAAVTDAGARETGILSTTQLRAVAR